MLGSAIKWVAVLVAAVAVLLPITMSHVAGGWTRKYTSSTRFTVADIPDLTGKVAIVTGANTGIGKVTALELAKAGAKVIMGCRSPSKCEAAAADIKADGGADVEPAQLDLGDFESIDGFAAKFVAKGIPLHILVNNAGVMMSPGEQFVGQKLTYGFGTTKQGFETHIGVNHIGHFKLTSLLMDSLRAAPAARVVSVSSAAEEGAYKGGMRYDLWEARGEDYEDGQAYGQSKLANILFASQLAAMEKEAGSSVTAYSCHPGIIQTELGRYMMAEFDRMAEGNPAVVIMNAVLNGLMTFGTFTAPDGALTQLHLATAPVESLVNGGYYVPIAQVATPKHPQGTDAALAKDLWEHTEAVIKKQYAKA